MNIYDGIKITIGGTAITTHQMMIREGCTGSPNCALEMYVGRPTYVDGPNLHMTDEEAEALYQAVKAIRKARRKSR